MKKITAFILLLLSLVSCNEKTAQDLFDESKTGVVLILNEYYYVMKLPNGNSIYFTGIDRRAISKTRLSNMLTSKTNDKS